MIVTMRMACAWNSLPACEALWGARATSCVGSLIIDATDLHAANAATIVLTRCKSVEVAQTSMNVRVSGFSCPQQGAVAHGHKPFAVLPHASPGGVRWSSTRFCRVFLLRFGGFSARVSAGFPRGFRGGFRGVSGGFRGFPRSFRTKFPNSADPLTCNKTMQNVILSVHFGYMTLFRPRASVRNRIQIL